MQKLITKYGLAAHLALVAVAPLFLSPTSVLWLSALLGVWILMEPSRIGSEMQHTARARVVCAIFTDPLFWFSIVLVAYVAIRFANGGVSMAYDAEVSRWSVSKPHVPVLPGSTLTAGYPELASAVALLIALQGVRHALGKSGRMAFLLVSSALAGLGGVVYAIILQANVAWAVKLAECAIQRPEYLGSIMGVYWLAGTIALVSAYERKWLKAMPLSILSIGGTAAGLFLFAPAYVQVGFVGAEVLLLVYSFFYMRKHLPGSGEFKYLVTYSMAMVLGGVLVVGTMPEKQLEDRIVAFQSGEFLSERLIATREALSDISLKVWKEQPWIGTGLGSFPIDLRFHATEADWAIVAPEQEAPLNGYWSLLSERGIVGMGFIACALGFLLWTFFRRLWGGGLAVFPHPACWLGVMALLIVLAETVLDCSCLKPGMFLVMALLLALSANSFAKEDRNG